MGAISGLATFGIGGAASSVSTNFFSRAAVAAAGHGFFQGTTTFISGGEFWSGFAAGSLSSLAASAWSGGTSIDANGNSIAGTGMKGLGGNLATNDYGMVAFGTVMGGASAELSGGNFWQGAVTGLVVSGLNHAMHPIDNDDMKVSDSRGDCPDCPKKAGSTNTHNSLDGNTYEFSNGGWHLVGPTLRTLGAELVPKSSAFAKYMFEGSRVVGGASKGTSVASLALRKALPQRLGTRILGTKVLGGVAGRLVPIIGEGLIIYDVVTSILPSMYQGFQANYQSNQRSGNWIGNIPH